MKPCEHGHPCVWMRDAGTAYKCALPRCVVSVTEVTERESIVKDRITGALTWTTPKVFP